MSGVGKLPVFMVLAALGFGVRQSPPEKTAGPPPLRMPFARVRAEGVFTIPALTGLGTTADAVWAVSRSPAAVMRIDPKDNSLGKPVELTAVPCGGAAAEFGALWVPLCSEPGLARIDVKTLAVTTTPVPGLVASAGSLTTGIGSVWMLADGKGTVLRLDPDTGRAVADVYVAQGSSAIAFGLKAIWTAGGDANQVIRINPHTNLIEATIPAGKAPRSIAVGENAIWVLSQGDGTVIRIDPVSNRIAATIDLGVSLAGGSIAAGEGSVWVAAPGAPLSRIDPRTNRLVQQFSSEGGGGPLAVAHRSLWIAVSADTLWRVDPKFVEALR